MKYLLLLIYPFFSFSQQNNVIKIDYSSSREDVNNIEHLYIKGDSALFRNDSLTIINEFTKIINEENSELEIKEKKIVVAVSSYFSTNFNQIMFNSVFDSKAKKLIGYKDELPKINWIIYDSETKQIGDYIAVKAIGMFRGSEIEAYFCPELPLQFGPWKFKGLPGLILEVTARNKVIEDYHWIVTKIDFDCKEQITFKHNSNIKLDTFKKRKEKEFKLVKEHIKMANSQVPKGVTVGETVIFRGGIEQEFEWEK